MILRRQRAIRSETHCCVLFPTYASRDPVSGSWRIPVFGGVYELGEMQLRKRVMLNLLQKVMRVDPAILQGPRFHERILPFVASGEAGLKVEIRVGGDAYPLRRRTRRNGLFYGVVTVEDRSVRSASRGGATFPLAVGVHRQSDELAVNHARLVDSRGVSVVSDIDDTIKVTEVGRREELLANTFLRDFRSVEGMAPVYRRWADQGAVFHYVSSSPWQLFQPLSDMTTSSGFPLGSMHLRSFRLRDHMLRRLLLIHRRGKRVEIGGLMKAFPDRSFVLIGDSGEKDPEIYASLARRRPGQVQRILIRNMPHRPLDMARAKRVFARLSVPWQAFQTPEELPESL